MRPAASQRFAFTVGPARPGLLAARDTNGGIPHRRPLLFDDAGRPKPALTAVEQVFARG